METDLRCARCRVYVADEVADSLERNAEQHYVCVNTGRCDERVARRQFLAQISPRSKARSSKRSSGSSKP